MYALKILSLVLLVMCFDLKLSLKVVIVCVAFRFLSFMSVFVSSLVPSSLHFVQLGESLSGVVMVSVKRKSRSDQWGPVLGMVVVVVGLGIWYCSVLSLLMRRLYLFSFSGIVFFMFSMYDLLVDA